MNDISIYMTTTVTKPIQLKILKKSLSYARKHYTDERIIIIDDGSNSSVLTKEIINDLTDKFHCEFIHSSEHEGLSKSGELLRLYFYLHDKNPTRYAICLHDSQLINSRFQIPTGPYRFLFTANHAHDADIDEINLLTRLRSPKLLNLYFEKSKWLMCFGAQCIISHSFLKEIDKEYPALFKTFIRSIESRVERMCCERIFGLVCSSLSSPPEPLFGDIFAYAETLPSGGWGYTFDSFEIDRKIRAHYLSSLPTIKIWVGR